MTDVLVVAAHPDDEVLGPGGTLAKHVARGDAVHALVLTEGATSRYQDTMQAVLADAARRSATVLGLSSIIIDTMPDQRLDSLPLIEVTQRIEAVADQVRPDYVYTHFTEDVNADHGIAARATWTACRPYILPQLRRFAVFETPSSTEWGWPTPTSGFVPNLHIDIAETLEKKLDAISCYESELRQYPHPRSLRALTERAAFWGSRVARGSVEPFHVLREMG